MGQIILGSIARILRRDRAGQRERAEWISELPSWFDQPLFLANERRLGVRHADTSPNRKLSARVLITTSTREMR